MKSKLARTVVALGIVALVAGIAPRIVAAAPAPKATASIDVHQVLAGVQTTFVVTVNQPVTALLTPATAVQIIPPAGLFKALTTTDPTGWDGRVNARGDRIFFTIEPGASGIGGGASQAFTFTADTLIPTADRTDTWSVGTSIDPPPAAQYTSSDPSAAGALSTLVRTLAILDITATAPVGVAGERPLTVTAGQTGVTVEVRVENLASGAQTVTTALAGGGKATPSAPQTASLAPGISIRTFTVAFGTGAGSGALTATASAPGSNAVAQATSFTIQSAFGAAYVANTLNPTDVVPGMSFGFTLSIDPSGQVELSTVDGPASALSFAGDAISAPLTTTAAIPGGGANTPLTFATTLIPESVVDADYPTGTLLLAGTDSNGAPVNLTVPVAQNLNVDRKLPMVVPTIGLPDAKVGTDKAATNGTTLTFSGPITDGPTKVCTSCTIVSAKLEQLKDTGMVIADADIPVTLTNNSGQLAGSVQVATWNNEAVATRLVVVVRDITGLSSEGVSALAAVDLVAPRLSGAITGGPNPNAPDLRRVDVAFSEPVILLSPANSEMGFPPGDWTCDGFTVTNATMAADHRSTRLTLDKDLGRDQKPPCSYKPNGPRLQDRVALTVLNQTVQAADGIIPGTPIVSSVADRAAIDGTYYTNQSTVELAIDNVADDYTVRVYEDADGNGTLEPSDPLKATETAEGPSVSVTVDLGGTERTVQLLTQAEDGTQNVGPVGVTVVTIDVTAPVMGTITRAPGSRTVSVTTGERLLGPAAANDWAVVGDGQAYITSVLIDSTGVVSLTIEDSRYVTDGSPADAVRYEVLDEPTRLSDLAGNLLADAEKSF